MRYLNKLFLLATLFFILATSIVFAAESQANGKMTLHGKSVSIKYAYAWIEPNDFHPDENTLNILLSEKPQNDPMSKPLAPAVALSLGLSSSYQWGLQVFTDKGAESIMSTDDRIIINSFDKAAIEGRSFHEDHERSWDVTFSTALLEPVQASPMGDRLSPDGGAPATVYRAYLKALKSGQPAEIRKLTTDDLGKMFSSPTVRTTILTAMKDKVNEEFQVISGFSDGKIATLFLKPDKSDDIKQTGIVKLVLMEGEWKISTDLFTKFF